MGAQHPVKRLVCEGGRIQNDIKGGKFRGNSTTLLGAFVC